VVVKGAILFWAIIEAIVGAKLHPYYFSDVERVQAAESPLTL
jgi:hypothetical protein